MEPLFVGEEWPSLAQKKATLQRARKHALLSELSPAELGQQGRFVFVDLGSRAFKSSTDDFLSHYPLASRFEIHAFGAPAADCTARAPAALPATHCTASAPRRQLVLHPSCTATDMDRKYVEQWGRSANHSKNRHRARSFAATRAGVSDRDAVRGGHFDRGGLGVRVGVRVCGPDQG